MANHTPRGAQEGEDEHHKRMDLQAMTQANGKTMASEVYTRVLKNQGGLKFDRTKLRCLTGKQVVQRACPTPGQTQEEPSLEAPHSAQTPHTPPALPQTWHSDHHWRDSAANLARTWTKCPKPQLGRVLTRRCSHQLCHREVWHKRAVTIQR